MSSVVLAAARASGGIMPTDESGRAIAARIGKDHPRWTVQFDVCTREFVAVARSGGPLVLRLESRDPTELVRRMRDAEERSGGPGHGERSDGQAAW
jgi:hypothetical protein